MTNILTYSEKEAIDAIDYLMNTYCNQCLLKSHKRKTEGKFMFTDREKICIINTEKRKKRGKNVNKRRTGKKRISLPF